MGPGDRRNIRIQILKELYDHHFCNGGSPKLVNLDGIDSEIVLAYQYLAEKSYISFKRIDISRKYEVSLLANGIDKTESEIDKTEAQTVHPNTKTVIESPTETSVNAKQNKKKNPKEVFASLGVFDMDKGYYR